MPQTQAMQLAWAPSCKALIAFWRQGKDIVCIAWSPSIIWLRAAVCSSPALLASCVHTSAALGAWECIVVPIESLGKLNCSVNWIVLVQKSCAQQIEIHEFQNWKQHPQKKMFCQNEKEFCSRNCKSMQFAWFRALALSKLRGDVCSMPASHISACCTCSLRVPCCVDWTICDGEELGSMCKDQLILHWKQCLTHHHFTFTSSKNETAPTVQISRSANHQCSTVLAERALSRGKMAQAYLNSVIFLGAEIDLVFGVQFRNWNIRFTSMCDQEFFDLEDPIHLRSREFTHYRTVLTVISDSWIPIIPFPIWRQMSLPLLLWTYYY